MRNSLVGGVAVLILLAVTGSPARGAAPSIQNAIAGGLAWIAAYPAGAADDNLLEMIEEVIAFHSFASRDPDPQRRQAYAREIRDRAPQLLALLARRIELGDHLLEPSAPVLLATAGYLLSYHGEQVPLVRDALLQILSLSGNRLSTPPSHRLWTLLYLQRLGVTQGEGARAVFESSYTYSRLSVGNLLPGGGAAEVECAVAPQLDPCYAITHDVLALTDFGRLSDLPLTSAERGDLILFLNAAIMWAVRNEQTDILGELVMSAVYLDAEWNQTLGDALRYLLEAQELDGSWGETNPHRADSRRHGVLVAVGALTALRTLAPPKPETVAGH